MLSSRVWEPGVCVATIPVYEFRIATQMYRPIDSDPMCGTRLSLVAVHAIRNGHHWYTRAQLSPSRVGECVES